MRIKVSNQITDGPKLADVKVDGLRLHVKLVDEPIEFTCESIDEYMTTDTLKWLFSEEHKDWTIGLSSWKILEANVPFKQSRVVRNYEFVQEMKEGKSKLARLLKCI